jgi:hypothetical protein
MPIKPDITNTSDALWSAAVERERVIAALVAAPQNKPMPYSVALRNGHPISECA